MLHLKHQAVGLKWFHKLGSSVNFTWHIHFEVVYNVRIKGLTGGYSSSAHFVSTLSKVWVFFDLVNFFCSSKKCLLLNWKKVCVRACGHICSKNTITDCWDISMRACVSMCTWCKSRPKCLSGLKWLLSIWEQTEHASTRLAYSAASCPPWSNYLQ